MPDAIGKRVAVPPDRDKCEFQPEQIELRLPMVDAFGIAACSAQAGRGYQLPPAHGPAERELVRHPLLHTPFHSPDWQRTPAKAALQPQRRRISSARWRSLRPAKVLARADLALCEQAGDPRRSVLGQGEQERLDLLRSNALGRCCQDVTDPDAACCQRPLQLRSADADFVRSAQCLESLSAGARGRHPRFLRPPAHPMTPESEDRHESVRRSGTASVRLFSTQASSARKFLINR
jgi:hypothetical protein